jgi:hypothetical protein
MKLVNKYRPPQKESIGRSKEKMEGSIRDITGSLACYMKKKVPHSKTKWHRGDTSDL